MNVNNYLTYDIMSIFQKETNIIQCQTSTTCDSFLRFPQNFKRSLKLIF